MKNHGFYLELFSDPNYEDLVANIYWNGLEAATVSQEKGMDKPEVRTQELGKYPLDEFVKWILIAKNRLFIEFRIEICHDPKYKKMIANIFYGNGIVAIVTQENGIDQMEIHIEDVFTFPLNEFIQTILSAKKQLIEIEKTSQ